MISLENSFALSEEISHIVLEIEPAAWEKVRPLICSDGGWKEISVIRPGKYFGYHATITDPEVAVLQRLAGHKFSCQIWRLGPEAHLKKNIFNPLVHRWQNLPAQESTGLPKTIMAPEPPLVPNDLEGLTIFCRDNHLVLSEEEIKTIHLQYQKLGKRPSLIELETLAQTWSEHCKHKIFAGKFISSDGKILANNIFKTYLVPTVAASERQDLVSVFSDNAGVVKLDDHWNYCAKVETHNSPCAKEPFGGAMTGVGGVVRDILGTAIGAEPIAGMDVFCFPPRESSPPSPAILPVDYLRERVRLGVQTYGNSLGLPCVAGSVTTHESYFAKPLVFVGCLGIIPSHLPEKHVDKGDAIIMVGGAVGRDGIHGATLSSASMTESAPSSMVQIGEPWVERNVWEFVLKARDLGFIKSITDNGAGGLSSSIGEMAQETHGAIVHLDRVPTKDTGILPHEIWISESQERMTLAVSQNHVQAVLKLAHDFQLEACHLGEFTTDGRIDLRFGPSQEGSIDLEFLHKGCPQKTLVVQSWDAPSLHKSSWVNEPVTPQQVCELLEAPNVRSRRKLVEQYDHEVQARTLKKPFEGPGLGPSDGSVLRTPGGNLAVGFGICPKYSEVSARLMTFGAFSEAIANLLCTGVDPASITALDNFCWPDPEKDPKRAYDLLESVQELHKLCCETKIPLISGKDSMKNNWENPALAILPTLLVTALGKVPQMSHVKPNFFTKPGLYVYRWGNPNTHHLGLSELAILRKHDKEPTPTLPKNFWDLQKISTWRNLASAIKDISEGGTIATLCEMCFGGNVGLKTNQVLTNQWGSEEFGQFILAFEQEQHSSELEFLGRTEQTFAWLGPDHWNLDLNQARNSYERHPW